METVVGLDVHGKETMYICKNREKEIIGKGTVETSVAGFSELCRLKEIPKGSKIGLETGTQAFFVARQLQKHGMKPVIIHAKEVRQKATRPKQKDDFRDAGAICEGVLKDYYEQIVHVPALDIQKLRDLLYSRRHFIRIRTTEVNAAKGILRRAGLAKIYRRLTTEVAWKKLMLRIEDAGYGELCASIEMHLQVWKVAKEQIEKLNEQIDEFVKTNEHIKSDLDLLKTIPGVGDIVGLTAIAVYSDISRFPDAKHAASYSGLVTETRHSGEKSRFGHITKTGSKELRAMLVEAAQTAGRPNQALNPFLARMCAKKGYKIALVALAHKLSRIIYAMLRDKVEFNAERLGIEKGVFIKQNIRQYRLKK